MSSLRKILPILALIALCDAHLGIMQMVTWVEMTADSVSKNESALESIYRTITGEKKCSRCCQLEKERERKSERALQWETKALGLNLSGRVSILPPHSLFEPAIFEHTSGKMRRDAPLSPPPWS